MRVDAQIDSFAAGLLDHQAAWIARGRRVRPELVVGSVCCLARHSRRPRRHCRPGGTLLQQLLRRVTGRWPRRTRVARNSSRPKAVTAPVTGTGPTIAVTGFASSACLPERSAPAAAGRAEVRPARPRPWPIWKTRRRMRVALQRQGLFPRPGLRARADTGRRCGHAAGAARASAPCGAGRAGRQGRARVHGTASSPSCAATDRRARTRRTRALHARRPCAAFTFHVVADAGRSKVGVRRPD